MIRQWGILAIHGAIFNERIIATGKSLTNLLQLLLPTCRSALGTRYRGKSGCIILFGVININPHTVTWDMLLHTSPHTSYYCPVIWNRLLMCTQGTLLYGRVSEYDQLVNTQAEINRVRRMGIRELRLLYNDYLLRPPLWWYTRWCIRKVIIAHLCSTSSSASSAAES